MKLFFDVAREINEIAEKIEEAEALLSLELVKQAQKAKSTQPSLPGGTVSGRPLHFIWILDCSSSMKGDKIQALNTAIRESIPELKKINQSYPGAFPLIRAITFSSGAKWHLSQPTDVNRFNWTDVEARGKRDMGKALQMVADELKMPPMERRSLCPILVLVTDGYPTDDAEQGIKAILDQPWGRRAMRIGIGIGNDAPYELLKKFINYSEIEPLQGYNMGKLVAYITQQLLEETYIIHQEENI